MKRELHAAKHVAKKATIAPVSPKNRRLYAEFLNERIYGTITLLALNAGLLYAVDKNTPPHALLTVLSTAVGLWAASLIAEFLSYRVVHDKSMNRHQLGHIALAHRGILIAAVPALFMLALAVAEIVSLRTALVTSITLEISAMIVTVLRSSKTQANSFRTALISVIV